MTKNRNIREEHFKTKKKVEDKLKFLLKYAILAPSGYNNQPWKFRIKNNVVEIWTDLSQIRKVIDPENRESYISTGTAITNLVLTAENFGFETEINIKRNIDFKNNLDLSAIITFGQNGAIINKQNRKLFEAISKRQTNRQEYKPLEMSQKDKQELEKYKDKNGVILKFFYEDNVKKKLASMVAKAGLYWYQREDFRQELVSWLSRDTIDGGNEVWQKFYKGDNGDSQIMTKSEKKSVRDENLVNQASAIMVIGSKKDKKSDWIKTGMELEKYLLWITSLGIQHDYFNTIVQSNEHRLKLKTELGNKFWPQLFLRLGKAKKVGNSPRRDMSEFILAID